MLALEIIRDDVKPYLLAVDERLTDFTVPLTKMLEDGLFSAQQQIAEGKGSAFGGEDWPPMAEATIKKGRDPATLLEDSGALLFSLTRGGRGNAFNVGPTEGEAGSALVSDDGFGYPAALQYGTRRMPARPFLVWYAERFSAYDAMMLDWITEEAAVA